MPELILRTQHADGRTIAQPISALAALAVEPGATYTIVDAQTQETPAGLGFERKDEDLEIQLEGEAVVVLDDFYTAETSATFTTDAFGGEFALTSADLPAVSEAGAMDVAELPHVSDGGIFSIPAGATLANPLTWGTPGLIGGGVVGAAAVGTGVGVGVSGSSSSSDSPAGPDTSVVVFDLAEDGDSSDHSDQTFDANTSYTIYIRVPSDTGLIELAANERWRGADNLGADDLIVLVGDNGPVNAFLSSSSIQSFSTEEGLVNYWSGSEGSAAFSLGASGNLWRYELTTSTTTSTTGSSNSETITFITTSSTVTSDSARLFTTETSWSENPNSEVSFSEVYLTTMPAGVLTSQGLA